MKDREIKCFLIDDKEIKLITIKANLESYYKTLNCETIDIQERKINDVYYDFIINDEGLFIDNHITAININKDNQIKEFIVGNLIICRHDGEGNEISIINNDIANILKACKKINQDFKINKYENTQTLKAGAPFIEYSF